jgi:hypothetical protein
MKKAVSAQWETHVKLMKMALLLLLKATLMLSKLLGSTIVVEAMEL